VTSAVILAKSGDGEWRGRCAPLAGGSERKLESETASRVGECDRGVRGLDSNASARANVLLSALSRSAATDFPPRRTGIPVRPSAVAVGSALAAPVVLDPDRDCLSPDSLDADDTADAFFSWLAFSSFAAFSSLSKAFTFSEAAARRDAVLSVPDIPDLLLAPKEVCGLSPDWTLGVAVAVLAAVLEDADGGFNRDDVLFIFNLDSSRTEQFSSRSVHVQ
jgi:hypothetical protein